MPDWTVHDVLRDFESGRIDRRQFITTLTRVGVPIGVVASILASCSSKETATTTNSSTPTDTAPFQPTQRGGGGQLKLLWWQAPSILNPHLSNGQKDIDASAIFYEQLVYLDAN